MIRRFSTNIKGLAPLFVLLIVAACEKETTNIGVDLLPGNSLYSGTKVEITDIVARSVTEQEIRTDALSTSIIGTINDPLFGESRASVATRAKLPVLDYDFSEIQQFDSVTLTIKFDLAQAVKDRDEVLVYGDLEDPITIDVYRLEESLEPDSAYYHDHQFAMGSIPLGTFSGVLPFFDSVEVKTETDTFMTGPELHIRLDDAFGQELISQPAATYGDEDLFLDYLKGLVFVPRLEMAPGDGVFVGLDFSSSQSLLQVHHDTTKTKDFIFNKSLRVSLYEVNGQGMQITDQHQDSVHFNTVYAQAMGGSKVRIDLPGLDSIIEFGDEIVINEAVLRIRVKDGSFDEDHLPPVRMLLLEPTETGGNGAIVDFTDDIAPPSGWAAYTNYGGYYNSADQSYEFHFNRYLQELIQTYRESGENTFDGFYLVVPSDFSINPARVSFDTDLTGDGIEVSVTYTKLN